MQRIGQELAQGRLEKIRHALEIDVARRQQPADRVGQAVALGDRQRHALVRQALGPAPPGQRSFDAEESSARGADFGRHAPL